MKDGVIEMSKRKSVLLEIPLFNLKQKKIKNKYLQKYFFLFAIEQK